MGALPIISYRDRMFVNTSTCARNRSNLFQYWLHTDLHWIQILQYLSFQKFNYVEKKYSFCRLNSIIAFSSYTLPTIFKKKFKCVWKKCYILNTLKLFKLHRRERMFWWLVLHVQKSLMIIDVSCICYAIICKRSPRVKCSGRESVKS